MDNFDKLTMQLQSIDAMQRSDAIFQLQPNKIDDARAVSVLVNILCMDDDLNVIEDATWVLVRYAETATVALLKEVTHDNSRARHNIVHALGKIADVQAVPALIIATEDSDASVRLKAVYALGQIGDVQAIDALIRRLADSIQDIQWTAREVLEKFGEKAQPHLIHALSIDSIAVQELSAGLLGNIGDKGAVEPLIAAIDTVHWQVRFAIIEALGEIGDMRALPIVEQMMHDLDPRVRAIAKAVSKLLSRL